MFFPNQVQTVRSQDQILYDMLKAFETYEVPVGATPVVGLNTDEGQKFFVITAREVTQAEIDMHTGMLRG